DRRAARHRLQDAVAEALVQRRIEEAGRTAVEVEELPVADAAERLGALAAPAPRDEEPGVGPAARFDRGDRVVAGIRRTEVEDVVAAPVRRARREAGGHARIDDARGG